jgi:hypothetical protein
MSINESGSLLERIGQMIAEVLPDGDPEGAFMYAEAGDQWVEAGIFKDLGEKVLYRDPSGALVKAILELWDAEPGRERKWSVLKYQLSQGSFSADFDYPNDLDPKESSVERRPRVLVARFGDKPVDYSDP